MAGITIPFLLFRNFVFLPKFDFYNFEFRIEIYQIPDRKTVFAPIRKRKKKSGFPDFPSGKFNPRWYVRTTVHCTSTSFLLLTGTKRAIVHGRGLAARRRTTWDSGQKPSSLFPPLTSHRRCLHHAHASPYARRRPAFRLPRRQKRRRGFFPAGHAARAGHRRPRRDDTRDARRRPATVPMHDACMRARLHPHLHLHGRAPDDGWIGCFVHARIGSDGSSIRRDAAAKEDLALRIGAKATASSLSLRALVVGFLLEYV